ncbi:MAG: hypothetical protein MMC33_007156 [Icmadophila ericetorum]|nr:hypothetical protein [Icmadophila ericetorum]
MQHNIAISEFSDDSSLGSTKPLRNYEHGESLLTAVRSHPANAQQKLIDLRAKVFRSRLKLKEKRSELREEHSCANELDAKFMSLLRQCWVKRALVEESIFESAYEELEEKRNLIGTLEYEYDQAEYDYEEVEALLDNAEEQYLESVTQDAATKDPGAGDKHSFFSLPTELSLDSLTSKKSDLLQSLYEKYQDRLGDSRIMRERLEDLRHQHDIEAKNIERQKNIGHMVDESLFQSLDDLKQDYRKTEAQIMTIDRDLEDIQASLKAVNIPITKSSEFEAEVLEVEPTPSIQSDLGPQTHHSDSVLSYLRENFSGARARINSWILETLKVSPIEHAHHKSILRAMQDISLDDRAWAHAVLEYWGEEKDGIATPTREERSHSDHRSSFALLSSGDLASKAVEDFDLKFSAIKTRHSERKKLSWIVRKFQAKPYEIDFVGFDRPVHESRSV